MPIDRKRPEEWSPSSYRTRARTKVTIEGDAKVTAKYDHDHDHDQRSRASCKRSLRSGGDHNVLNWWRLLLLWQCDDDEARMTRWSKRRAPFPFGDSLLCGPLVMMMNVPKNIALVKCITRNLWLCDDRLNDDRRRPFFCGKVQLTNRGILVQSATSSLADEWVLCGGSPCDLWSNAPRFRLF